MIYLFIARSISHLYISFISHRLRNTLRIHYKRSNNGINNNNKHKRVVNCNKSPTRHYVIKIASIFLKKSQYLTRNKKEDLTGYQTK